MKEAADWVGSKDAFEEELDVIVKSEPGQDRKDKRKNLVGLAFSGGGIRSATFNLGVLEGLKELDLLKKIDYLSTVSGGGYIGAWLSANRKRHPGFRNPGANWSDSIRHLRRYSNYLAPQLGFFSADTWTMLMVWIRNTVLVQVTVILAIAAALMVPRLMMSPLFIAWAKAGDWRWVTVFLLIMGVVGIAGNLLRVSRTDRAQGASTHAGHLWILDPHYWLRGLACAVPCLAAAGFIGWNWNFTPFTYGKVNGLLAGSIAILLVAGGFLLLPVAAKIVLIYSTWRGRKHEKDAGQINYNQGWVQAVVVAPLMLAGLLVAAVMWGYVQPENYNAAGGASANLVVGLRAYTTFGALFVHAPQFWPFPLTVVFTSLLLLAYGSVRTVKSGYGVLAMVLAPIASIVVLHALMCAVMLLFQYLEQKGPSGEWSAYVWGPSAVLYAFSLAIVTLIGIVGRQSTEGAREWWSRLGAWLGIYGAAWMVICVATVYGPYFFDRVLEWKYSLGTGWIGSTIAGLMAGHSGSTGGKKSSSKSTTDQLLDIVAKVAPFIFIGGLLILVAMLLHEIVILNSDAVKDGMKYWYQLRNVDARVNWSVMAGCVALLLLFAARVDINEFSLNAFYRSRLVRCYLGATKAPATRHPQHFTNFDDADDVLLSELSQDESAGANDRVCGPFHIVNCSLNLGGSSDLTVHTRHSASFTLTPLRCGSAYLGKPITDEEPEEIGYGRTEFFGGEADQPSLGEAISVSGAAASPNQGYHTSSVVAFLMTLFNVRLGWWFPKPVHKGKTSPTPWFSLRYLLLELFGLANDQSKFLAVSDGGHFENLGAYELIRRKCRVIVIGDAECDPDLTFEGLGTLIRMCEVDFNTKIEIDVSSIAKGDADWSENRCAVGKISYLDAEGDEPKEGILIYLKASMTGRENTSILQYKSGHETFPHETTGDQFYGEDQFESYRLLGKEIALATFEPALFDLRKPAPAAEDRASAAPHPPVPVVIAERLINVWSPTLAQVSQFTRNTRQLMELWSDLGQTNELEFLDKQLAGGWPDESTPDFRQGFYVGSRVLQLMENVYLDLKLEDNWDHADNRGWKQQFKVWSDAEVVRETWKRTSETYGVRFRYFCERNLDLPLSGRAKG
ncbi:MAG TPA: patatin-like phospholipase family protein, partial [Bryobacteraceae bacterium]